MSRRVRLGCLAAVLACAAPAVRADDDGTAQALALEATMQRAIARAEPAIACVIVSRSDGYRQFGQGPDPEVPGRLGAFDFRAAGFRADTDDKRLLVERLNLADVRHVPDAYASGVLIDASGLVLTCYHAVRNATKIYVRLPGQRDGSYADIHAADDRSDLAVLRLLSPPPNPTVLPLGDGSKVRKGQLIISLANPFAAGFRDGSPSASWGIVSNVRRRVVGEYEETQRKRKLHYYGTLLQADARLNLGCSGGALIDLKGNLIGLTTTQAALAGGETAGGFAFPLDETYRRVIETLRRGEEVEYGFLGVQFRPPRFDGWPANDGSVLAGVMPRSPAQEAGLQPGDRILSIDGNEVHDSDDVFQHVSAGLAGTEIALVVQTPGGGGSRKTKATLAKFHWAGGGPVIAANRPAPVFGLRVDYTSILAQLSPFIQQIPYGVLVREVKPGSPAATAGLEPEKTLILEVNGRPVNSPKEFYEAARRAGASVKLTLAEPSGKVVQLP